MYCGIVFAVLKCLYVSDYIDTNAIRIVAEKFIFIAANGSYSRKSKGVGSRAFDAFSRCRG